MLSGSQQSSESSQQSSQQDDFATNQIDSQFEERMERLWKVFGVDSDTKLAKALGLKQQTISSARTKKQITPSWLIHVTENYGISCDWILYGTGPMRRGDPRDFGACLPAEDYILVPQLESRVAAGPDGEILYQDVSEYFPFKKWWVDKLVGRSHEHARSLILIRVRGDSMSPTIDQGEVALVDTHEAERLQVLNGRIYLIIQPDGAISLKRLVLARSEGIYRLVCLSDNTSFRPFEFLIEPGKTIKNYVLGRIRWAGKEFD